MTFTGTEKLSVGVSVLGVVLLVSVGAFGNVEWGSYMTGAMLALVSMLGVVLFQQARRRRLVQRLLLHAAIYKPGRMPRRTVVDAVLALFRVRGYTIGRVEREAGGVCFVELRKDGKRIGLKIFPDARPLEIVTVTEVHRDFQNRKLECGYIVTVGECGADAVSYAADHANSLHLIDRHKLSELMSTEWTKLNESDPIVFPALELKSPNCPICGAVMNLKKPEKRRAFWGCSRWPLCHGRREPSAHDKRVMKVLAGRDS